MHLSVVERAAILKYYGGNLLGSTIGKVKKNVKLATIKLLKERAYKHKPHCGYDNLTKIGSLLAGL